MMSEVPVGRNAQTEMASEIVAAYVRHNSVPVAEMPSLIRSVYDTLTSLGSPEAPEASTEPLKPAVSIKKSVTDEFIISLEDGRKFKSMKRYLAGLGMTPADYRAKWGLPSDYPMVAPAYAARRSELAKTIGLGRKGVGAAPELVEELASPPEPEVDAPAPKRGGRKKVA
jgi:predicted transcriptional regulator